MTKNKRGSAFAVAQQIGKSLFLPIAILPFAGILLGLGSTFTNETTIATYGLSHIFYLGSIPYGLMSMFKEVGNCIFTNLALIFALAVAIGLAKKEKGVAALSAGLFYIIMLVTMNVLLRLSGYIVDGVVASEVPQGAIASVLGIQTLQMGVFGGVVAGIMAAVLTNRFYKTSLPNALAFFSGTRFVPIVCMLAAVGTGIVLFLLWPFLQSGIYSLALFVQKTGYFGTFLYGLIERALIPFGLHHIFYMPFWQTSLGGTKIINDVTVMGAQNIFFAELADPNTTHFSVEACRFLTGKYPFMMGGLPGAALAMIVCARPKKRKVAASLLFSAALTAFITGVTEPIEFTFLFLAPVLFGIHALLAGLSFALCHILEICVGTTFSDGLIDLILYGILPGQSKTNWLMLIPLIAIYFVIYFLLFTFFIKKFNLKTPGREDDGEATHLVSKEEYRNATGVGLAGGGAASISDTDMKSAMILMGVGGEKNVLEIDCCATRLRLTLADDSLVDKELLKTTGASGVVIKANAIQVIYGPSVTIVKCNFEEYVDKIRSGEIREDAVFPQASSTKGVSSEHDSKTESSSSEALHSDAILGAHMTGTMLLMNEVSDPVFASCSMGEGAAIEPAEGKLYAPCDGKIDSIFDTNHAVCMTSKDGAEILLHIGVDTVKLGGKHFTRIASEDAEVKKGDLLITFDMDAIKSEGYCLTTPVIIVNTDEYKRIRPIKTGNVEAGQDFVELQG